MPTPQPRPPAACRITRGRIAAKSLHERYSALAGIPPGRMTALSRGRSGTWIRRYGAYGPTRLPGRSAGTGRGSPDGSSPGLGHDRVPAVTPREVAAWRDHLAAEGIIGRDGTATEMAPATVNNHLAHLLALFSWITVHAPAGLLRHGDPTKKVEPLPLPAPQVRALAGPQVRTVKNVLDRIEGFHQLNGRRHRGQALAVHRHARPLRDRAIVHLILGTGLRRGEITGLDLAQLDPADPAGLRRVKKARLNDVRGKGRTSRSVFLGRDARNALADYLEAERPGDADEQSEALFLPSRTIAARRPGGRLSPRSVNTIVGEIGRIHDAETADRDRHLGSSAPTT